MRLPNFDRIAFAYDALKYLVFGGSLHQAQTFLVPFIPTCSDILIIGGGTGQIILDIVETKEIKQNKSLKKKGSLPQGRVGTLTGISVWLHAMRRENSFPYAVYGITPRRTTCM